MDADTIARTAAFLQHEADLLDGREYQAWLRLFDPDGWYWIPVSPSQASPHGALSHIHDTLPALTARVAKLLDPRNITQDPPSRTCRLLGAPGQWRREGDLLGATARFQLAEARPQAGGQPQPPGYRWFAGQASYLLRHRDDGLRIVMKRVDLIDSEAGYAGVSILL